MTFVKAYYRGRKPADPLWCEVLEQELCAHLLDVLPRWVEQDRLSQFSEDMRDRLEQSF
jgi:hypothetical protein